jgi:hypothetical protein
MTSHDRYQGRSAEQIDRAERLTTRWFVGGIAVLLVIWITCLAFPATCRVLP